MKRLIALFFALTFAAAAQAQIITSLPFTLTNGTTADATQVMADFNQIVSNTNSNAAHNGANTDITSLLGLTTALDFTLGGNGAYVGTGGGSANVQTVSSLTPTTGFSYLKGKSVTWLATVTNTGATTLNVSALGAKNVFQLTATGQAALVGGEIQNGALITATYDGTEFVLQNANNVVRLDNLSSLQGGIAVPTPQGRLTPTCGTPVISADATAATSVCYDPYNGNLLPIYNGTYMQVLPFAELTLTLTNAGFAANTVYDVFAFLNAGVVTIGIGPGWTTAGNFVRTTVLTTGTAARATALTRVNGILVNTGGSMTARNGATTYTVATQQGTYLGSIWIDAAAQAVTCQVSFGQNRSCGVWNMYNRVPMMLTAGDTAAAWTYNTATIRAADGTAANSITVLVGFAEEWLDARYSVFVTMTNNATTNTAGIGAHSTTAFSGLTSQIFGLAGLGASSFGVNMLASYSASPFIGTEAIVALEKGNGTNGVWAGGGQTGNELRVAWRG